MAAAAAWKRPRALLLLLALALVALLAWAPRGAAALGGKFEKEEDEQLGKEDVAIDLSVKAYEAAMASTDVWIIDYFQDDCAACVQMKPFMDQLAKEVYPFGVKVGVFDMKQSSAARKLGIAAGLVKLPALKLFVGPPSVNPYTGKALRASVDYIFVEGAGLDTNMLKRWVIKNVPSHVVKATADMWPDVLADSFVATEGSEEEGPKSVVLTLTDRESTPTLLKTLAIKYAGSFAFVEAPPTEAAFHEAFGVSTDDLAQLYVLPASKGADSFLLGPGFNASAAARYEWDLREPEALQAFLDKFAKKPAAAKKGATGKKAEEEEAKRKAAAEEEEKKKQQQQAAGFKELNATNFQAEVYKATEAWMVWFKPSADATSEEWTKHVSKAEGLLKLGAVDCSAPGNAALCKAEKGAAYPFKAYPHGGDKEDEAKGFTSAAGAYQECGESVPDVLRPVGDGGNQMLIDQEVNMAFASHRFPAVVITNKPEPALLFKALALKLQPYLHFILVSAPSAAFLERFNRAAVPSVHILIPQDMSLYTEEAIGSQGVPAQHALRIESYLPGAFGPMKFLSLANFFVQVVAQRADPERARAMVEHLADAPPPGQQGKAGSGARAATIVEVTDAASWAAGCPAGGALLCVVGLFRGRPGKAAGAAEHAAMLKEVAAKEGHGAEAPWAFSYADGTCLAGFAEAFDVQEPKVPTVVVYSPRKQRFASFKGTLSASAVSEFLRGILSGSIPVAPVLREPRVDDDTAHCTGLGNVDAATAEAASGADGSMGAAAAEEEEDIGDLMAEILAEEQRKKEELAAAVKREQEARKKEEEAAAAAADGEPKKKIVRRKKKKAGSDEL